MSDGHEVAIPIAAPAEAVWTLLADVTRMGEWSPECVGCRWLPPSTAARPGARFKGTSRNGWHKWSTTSTVIEAEPGQSFVFDVTYFRRPVARWRYQFESPAPGTATVAESVEDQRGRILRTVSPFITGSKDRSTRNAATMQTTLRRLKAAAEK